MQKIFLILFLILTSCATVERDKAVELEKRMSKIETKLKNQEDKNATLDGKISELYLSSKEDRRLIREENLKRDEIVNKRLQELETFAKVQDIVNKKITTAISENRVLVVETKQTFEDFRASRIDVNTAYYIKKANELYNKGKYEKAHEIFVYYLKHPELLSEEEYRVVFYRTALMEYRLKKYDDALIHFSQLYRNFHEKGNKYIASSLYHVGIILLQDKKCADAKYVFDQVVNEYGDHAYFRKLAEEKINFIQKAKGCLLN